MIPRSLTLLLSTIFLAQIMIIDAAAQTPPKPYQNWYPSSIAAPAGHKYPCALTALPKDLKGIPETDRGFINHVYSMLLKCAQAKLVMIDEVLLPSGAYSAAYGKYYADTTAARQKIMAEPVPRGLESFRATVISAIDQQIQFFGKAVRARQAGKSAQDVLNIPEGKVASGMLLNAWSAMESRYPAMSAEVKDSTYHHLCALDVF